MRGGYSDVWASVGCIENDQRTFSLGAESLKILSFLHYFVKKSLACFLIIAFMAAITLCFYGFLREARFF